MKRILTIFICAALLGSLCVPGLRSHVTAAIQNDLAQYCLIGYINGADCGYGADAQNTTPYVFVSGKLTVSFTENSYIFIKTTDNAHRYRTQSFCEDTSATFYDEDTGACEGMLVPANTTFTFTLVEHEDGTLNLSYTEQEYTPTGTRKLSVTVPDSWINVYIYTWDPYEFGDYPGVEMQKNNDHYEFSLNNSITKLVISGRTESDLFQLTGDINLQPNDKDVTIKINEDSGCVISYGSGTHSPTVGPAQSAPPPVTVPQVTQTTPPPVTEPQVTQTTPPPVTEPQVTQTTPPPVTEPQVTQTTPPPVTEPQVTQTTPPPVTEPQVTEPTTTGSSISDDLPQPNDGDESTVPGATDPTTPTSNKPKPNALVNQPLQSMGFVLFGILAVFLYLFYLLLKRNSLSVEVTGNGQILRRSWLSKKAVAKAVTENMPAPSDKLDERVLEAIKNIEPPQTKS